MSATTFLKRTCPWCGDASVLSLTEEGLTRALTTHLETCPGDEA
jgi:ribosomal protein S27AE